MKNLQRYKCVLLSSCLLGMLVACANGPLGPLEPVPGNGPKGKPMPTSTDVVAGLPATPSTQLYRSRYSMAGDASADTYADRAASSGWLSAANHSSTRAAASA